MRHIKLDREAAAVRQFVLSLSLDPDGTILELKGEPLARVLPVMGQKQRFDKAKLKAAILRRRNESRRLNEDWEFVDSEVADQSQRTG